MVKTLPRGIRNNNPGNIDRNTTKWQGMADDQSSDPRFVVFKAPAWGIRALARVLITYQDQHDLATVQEIIGRWAPPNENDTGAYVRQVANAIGVAPNEHVNVHDHAVMLPLVKAIIVHENGTQPYSEGELNYGLSLAGVVPAKPKPLRKSPTVIGSTIASTATVGGAIVDQVKGDDVKQAIATVPVTQTASEAVTEAKDAVSYTLGIWEYAGIALAVLALLGVALVIYSKWERRKRGVE